MIPEARGGVWRLRPRASLRLRCFDDALLAYEGHSGDTLCFPPALGAFVRALNEAGDAGLNDAQLDALTAECEVPLRELTDLLAELQARQLVQFRAAGQ